MKRILFILFLFVVLTTGIFSLGRKDKQNPDEIDWTNIVESTLFGLVNIEKDKSVVIIVDPDGAKRAVYTLTGKLVNDVRKKAGKYLCIRGRINKDQNKMLITEVLVIQDSPEPDWNKAKEVEIEGKIEFGMNNMVCIITRWESKSRVSHYVYGPKADIIKKSPGQIIKVIGLEDTSPADTSPFVKEIIVEKIVALRED